MMRRLLLTVTVALSIVMPAEAGPLSFTTKNQIVHLNQKLCGSLVDFTRNHHHDYRFWSEALGSKRDMYVYLPPGYDPAERYPVMIWMHGFIQDEKNFLELIPVFDKAIAAGELPPMIIAAPDGSIVGSPSLWHAGSFYLNSDAGRYEDYLIVDVWNLLNENFSIRPEPEAHVLAGASMGGFGAYNLAIKHRDQFKIVAGIMPPLNIRYLNCHGHYMGNFDPSCFNLAERYRPHMIVGRFFGVVNIQQFQLIEPLFGHNRQKVIESIARENPLEMLDTYCVKPGELAMFIGYAGKDEFNIDAQVESFLDVVKPKGFDPKVVYEPNGRHNSRTGTKMLPEFATWVTPLLKPYVPPLKVEGR